jgi:hypothetical protein
VVLSQDAVTNPVVIVWDKKRGFDVFTVFDFIEGGLLLDREGESTIRAILQQLISQISRMYRPVGRER